MNRTYKNRYGGSIDNERNVCVCVCVGVWIDFGCSE